MITPAAVALLFPSTYEFWPGDRGEGSQGGGPVRQGGQDQLQELGHPGQALGGKVSFCVSYILLFQDMQ